MGIKKDVEKADGKITGHYNHDTHYAFTDDKNKQYVKKMFEANNQLQSGIISISISVLSIFRYLTMIWVKLWFNNFIIEHICRWDKT